MRFQSGCCRDAILGCVVTERLKVRNSERKPARPAAENSRELSYRVDVNGLAAPRATASFGPGMLVVDRANLGAGSRRAR